jgi:hypothetical protein
MKTTIVLVVSALALGACATIPVPADKLSRAHASVRAADELNAEADPTAALHLRLAREELAEATRILKAGDNGRASGILLRAEADANAARDLARERSARIDAEKAVHDVQQAKMQLQEGTKS